MSFTGAQPSAFIHLLPIVAFRLSQQRQVQKPRGLQSLKYVLYSEKLATLRVYILCSQVAQWYGIGFGPEPDPGDLGLSPMSGSLRGASFSLSPSRSAPPVHVLFLSLKQIHTSLGGKKPTTGFTTFTKIQLFFLKKGSSDCCKLLVNF